jgi:hypothetical protein
VFSDQQDRRTNAIKIGQDVVVPEADHLEALSFKPSGSVRRIVGVLCSVDFDDQPPFETDKIDDVTPDLLLSSKFHPMQAPVAQGTP